MAQTIKRIGAYLIYLVLITTVATAISFSRYGTTISGNRQTAVAKAILLQVPVGAEFNGASIPDIGSGISIDGALPGDTLIYHFKIVNYDGENTNQVTLKYRIEIDFVPNDPRTLPLTDDLQPDGIYLSAGGDWTYMGFGAQESHDYTLMVEWHGDYNDSSYKSLSQEVIVYVFAEQVD